MSRKHYLSGALIALISFLALSMAIAMTPAQQSAITSDQALFATLDFDHTQQSVERQVNRDQSTQIAQLWLTVDSQHISTLVATFTSTGTRTPTRTRTNTPSVLASPTQEVLTTPFSATPTFQSATNSPTPTRSPTFAPLTTPTQTPTELPSMTYGHNISGLVRNVRECPDLDCEVVATVAIDGTVVLDISQVVEADNYRWVRTWNEQGWVSVERLSPFARYIIWDNP